MRDFETGDSFGAHHVFYAPTDFQTDFQTWSDAAQERTIPRADLHGVDQSGGFLESSWDPTEELAFLLQDAMASERHTPPSSGQQPVVSAPPLNADGTAGLTQITPDLPPVRSPGPGHRKSRTSNVSWMQTASYAVAAVAAALVSMVSVFGGVIAYDPLRHVAQPRTHADVVNWWPLLVYGPWVVASLSILRAALHRRRAAHSWLIVLFFSLTAMLLCVAQAPRTFTDVTAAVLPTAASLACFHQLVRLITLTRPPRRAARRRRIAPTRFSHRSSQGSVPQVGSHETSLPL